MTLFQLTAILFALFMAYVVRVHQSQARLSKLEASFWYSLWFVFIVLAALPDLLIGIAGYFYFERVFDLLVVGSFMILAFLVVRSYFKYREIQVKIEKIIIENAIDRATSKLLPLHKKTVKKK
jgi:hypothetical protein